MIGVGASAVFPVVGLAQTGCRGADTSATDDVTVRTTLVPHVGVAVKTIPRSDGIRCPLTTNINAVQHKSLFP
jgi:hypothetical protein